ncbi:MAG: GNAT family N-acetyltransferase [Phycisphaeraceae bacterium]|nr:GNAT family N-acetyltransferase [Phycisphaeraceae bacterium]
MTLSLTTYARPLLPGIVDLFNHQADDEPHVAVLTPQLFVDLVESKPYFDDKGFFVALERDRVLGFLHACVAGGTEPWQNPDAKVGQITMLAFEPHRLDVGLELLDAALAWLAQSNFRGRGSILAMSGRHGYPFYRGIFLGGERIFPTTLAHLHIALAARRFGVAGEAVLKRRELHEPPPPESLEAKTPLDYLDEPLAMTHPNMAPSWAGFEPRMIRAVQNGRHAGAVGYLLQSNLTPRLGAPCINIYALGVEPAFQRRGIAAALVARVLQRGFELGARTATVATQLDNLPAHHTYDRLGYLPYRMGVARISHA